MVCVKTCDKFEAITLENNLAWIDPEKCKLCRKCEEACPRGAIHAFNFPPRKPKEETPAQPTPAAEIQSKGQTAPAPAAEAQPQKD